MRTPTALPVRLSGRSRGSINEIALHDFSIFKELFDYDFSGLEQDLGAGCIQVLMDYKNGSRTGKIFNRRVRDRICTLAKALGEAADVEDFKQKMTQFYKEFGVGKLGLHKAFRIEHPEGGRHGDRADHKHCPCPSG